MDAQRVAHRNLPAITAALSLASLVGWGLNAYYLGGSLPSGALTKFNAALCMALLAAATYLMQFRHRFAQRTAQLLTVAGALLALLTILEYMTRLDFGIDQAVVPDSTTDYLPGRMSPLSAIIIMILSVAILGETMPQRAHPLLAPTLYSLSLFLGLTALLGYLYGVPILYGTGPTTRVALPSALGLTILSLAGLLSTSGRSYVRLFLGPGPLARGARRMLFVAILMPALALWLRAPAERVGLIDPQSGAAFIALSSIPLLVVAVWWTVREINVYQDQVLAMQLQLERRVEERTLELERANKELEAFNYSVSHDLRNPLHVVRGGINIILQDPSATNIREFGPDVKGAADRMNEITESLLRLSRISRTELDRAPVDLSRLAEEVMTAIAVLHPRRAHQVDVEPGMVVDGDASLLRIVLENLLSNAWKFTRGRPEAKIQVGSEVTERGPCFFVRDNGIGFDLSQADRLFQPFHRLHRREEFEGTGVGLATVSRIVQRHGGQVFARGEPGRGATFYFSLPRAATKPTPAQVKLVAPTAATSPSNGAATGT